MLRIEPIKSYKLPRYPRGLYYERSDTNIRKVTGGIASVAMLALLVSSCEPAGVVGPPPMAPDMVTEREARTIINEVFVRNGIQLEADVPFAISLGDQYPVSLGLDGFNKDLNIGYEYITGEDQTTFTQEVIADLDKACESDVNGPYIKTVSAQYIYGDAEKAYEELENIIQDFIADLRSRGII
jgi:hypothetical protein